MSASSSFRLIPALLTATSLARRCLLLFLALVLPAVAAEPAGPHVALVLDAAPGRATRHGLTKLRDAFHAAGWKTEDISGPAVTGSLVVLAGTTPGDGAAARALRAAGVPPPIAAEALVVRRTTFEGHPALVLCGADDRGLMYALLDVAERVGWAAGAAGTTDPLREVREITESPFIKDRTLSVYTMNRAQWESRFYDEHYWSRYFDLLAADRFDRFLIVFGYENGGFLAPPYPYFFPTPGFPDVHMVDASPTAILSPTQQQRNLDALNRLIELAHDRGITVSLGIWDHIYRGAVQTGGAEWLKDYAGRPLPNSVEGVTTENLSAYTLASLQQLLARVPALDGLQFRIHEESGLKREEMDGFWRDVFTQVQRLHPGLPVELRAKGTPDSVIGTGLALGMKLRIETKFWMEQMGLPYHPTHVNPPDQQNRRHGYADLLRFPQRYPVMWRLWNGGTSRVLLWGDPDYVRRYSESAQLYDSPNWDVQEPLATKMEAQRPDLPVFALMPERYRSYDYEFERYWHFFQTWGRVGYNPAVSPEIWRHEFRQRFGDAAAPLESALHRASGVLPMIVAAVYPYRLFPTTRGWAERQSLGARLADYAKNEGTDTEQFEGFDEAAQRIVAGGVASKRTPADTSRWFDQTADAILADVQEAEAAAGKNRGREFESTVTDLKILAQLARFHARRALAAVHYNLGKRRNSPGELLAAITLEKSAVEAWRELVAAAGDRYTFDLAMGARDHDLCGHWRDELKALEADLQELEKTRAAPDGGAQPAVAVWGPSPDGDRALVRVEHERVKTAAPGQPLRIVARVMAPTGVKTVRLRYRHLTQYEDYVTLDLRPTGQPDEFAATVPGEFLVPQWGFMYFLEIIDARGRGANWPDLAVEAPYVIVQMAPK